MSDQADSVSDSPPPKPQFAGTVAYWEDRYAAGRDSGAGSSGRLAEFKAEFLNDFVARNGIESVLEFGCGDGRQLALARYPRYLGLDVAKSAIDRCIETYSRDATKSFLWFDPDRFRDSAGFVQAELALSLDVVFHLVEDETFAAYFVQLFGAAQRYVIVYSSNKDAAGNNPHVKHRKFTDHVAAHFPEWELAEMVPNRYPVDQYPHPEGSFSDFYIFSRR